MRRGAIGVVAVIFLLALGCLTARMGYLMLARGAELSAQAEKQHSRSLNYYQYARGDIVDREGRPFTSQKEPCLVLVPTMLRDLPELAASLSSLLHIDNEMIFSRLQAAKNQQLNPVIFKTGLSNEEAAAVREAALPGVLALNLAARYGRQGTASHILGQVQAGEQPTIMSGVSGIELQYNGELQGRVDDQAVSWVDAVGRLSSADWHVYAPDTIYRRDVRLTLDMDYQQIAERALAEYEGACVILDPHNGDILAAASSPGFDAYGWQPPSTEDAFINKAFAYYPPASTFKILLALAAADSGRPQALNAFCCEGSALVGDSHRINCWNRMGHGEESLAQALSNSCNPYFATLGWELGGSRLRQYLSRCGLENQNVLGYSVPQAVSLQFNNAVPGDVANVSIGENGARLTPLMVAQLVAVCANGGYALTPRLVMDVKDTEGLMLREFTAVEPRRAVSGRAAAEVASMLHLAVSEGTVQVLKDALLPVAAKTGTSEGAGVWCAGFAPYQPQDEGSTRWAISVYVANGSSGGREAATVFKRVIDDIAMLEGLADKELL